MNRAWRLGALLLLSLVSVPLRAQPPAAGARASSPLAPLAFLVGGIWHADLPNTPQGQTVAIEAQYEWSANHQGIRFDSTWIIAGRRHAYASGLYAWNPAQKRLALWYTDAAGSLTTGTVEAVAGVLRHDLMVTDRSGNAEAVRAEIVPVDAQTYTDTIFTSKDGQWQKLIDVRYQRPAPPDSPAAK
jgi:hypothetical protein